MKLLKQNHIMSFLHTMAVGTNIAEVTVPDFTDRQALVIKGVGFSLDSTSATPSITAAGVMIFTMALAGKDQSAPSDAGLLDELLWASFVNAGMTAGGNLSLGNSFSVVNIPIFARELFMFGHTANITNAATTIVRMCVAMDVYQATTSEYLDLL